MRVHGVAKDLQGNTFEDINISLVRLTFPWGITGTVSGPNGEFEFLDVADGRYAIWSSAIEGFNRYTGESSPRSFEVDGADVEYNVLYEAIVPSHAEKYFYRFKDRENNTVKVSLQLKDYDGEATEIDYSIADPVNMNYYDVGREDKVVVQGCKLHCGYWIKKDELGVFDDLIRADYRDWKVVMTVDNQKEFEGYLLNDQLDRSFLDDNIKIVFTASDGLKDLENYMFGQGGKMTIMEAVRNAIRRIGIALDFEVKLSTRETTQQPPEELSWLHTKFHVRRFLEGVRTEPKNPYATTRIGRMLGRTIYEMDTCLGVIDKLLRGYNVVLRQSEGKYVIQHLYEGDTYYYPVDWELGAEPRFAAPEVVDINNYSFRRGGVVSTLQPVKELNIVHYNRNLGELDYDFNDYDNYSYNNFNTVLSNPQWEVKLLFDQESDQPLAMRFDTLVNVTPVTDEDFLQVSLLGYIEDLYMAFFKRSIFSVGLAVKVKRPDGTEHVASQNPFWLSRKEEYDPPENYITGADPALKIVEAGDYEITFEIRFIVSPFANRHDMAVTLSNIEVRRASLTGEDSLEADIAFDTLHQLEFEKGKSVETHELYFADTERPDDLGVWLKSDESNTELWTDGSGEYSFVELYAKNYLTDRQKYKNFVEVEIIDHGYTIKPTSLIEFDGDTYRIRDYRRTFKHGQVWVALEQKLTNPIDYIYNIRSLTSVDGVSTRTSTTVVPPGQKLVHRMDDETYHKRATEHKGKLVGTNPDTGAIEFRDDKQHDRLHPIDSPEDHAPDEEAKGQIIIMDEVEGKPTFIDIQGDSGAINVEKNFEEKKIIITFDETQVDHNELHNWEADRHRKMNYNDTLQSYLIEP